VVTNFTKSSLIQTELIKEFPSGIVTGNTGLTVPFDIVSDASGHNYYDAGGTLSNNVAIPNVTHVFTLINAYHPPPGANAATIEFIGSQGTTQTFTLTDGTNIRDFFQGSFANTIDGTTTRNAFTVSGVQDAGGTGNVTTGAIGTYLVDEQDSRLTRRSPVRRSSRSSSPIFIMARYRYSSALLRNRPLRRSWCRRARR
jgi:hypothetical protein